MGAARRAPPEVGGAAEVPDEVIACSVPRRGGPRRRWRSARAATKLEITA
jgi:hypothetical protein